MFRLHLPLGLNYIHLASAFLNFLTNDIKESSQIISLDQNKYPKGMVVLEFFFSPSDPTNVSPTNKSLCNKTDKTMQVNIRTDNDPKMSCVS